MTARLAQDRRGGTETLTETAYSIQHTPGHLNLQREWGWMETMETAPAHIST